MVYMTTKKKPHRNKRFAKLLEERFNGRQKDMADALGIVENLISRYAYGGKGIGETMKEKIHEKLGLPPTWLDDDEDQNSDVVYYSTNDPKKRAMIEMILAIQEGKDSEYAEMSLRLVTGGHKGEK